MTSRPLLRWPGGKWLLAPWIIGHFPEHRVYVEPFGGAASVLLRKPPVYLEVYNDLDDELCNLFAVLRSRRARRLIDQLTLTPFSRAEFALAYASAREPVERARRLICRSFMGHGSGASFFRPTGFRANANAGGNHNTAAEWSRYPRALSEIVARFAKVVIESRDARAAMAAADTAETLHYVDPPYLPATRSPRSRQGGALYHAYAHELSTQDHLQLMAFLRDLEGMVVLSGYPSELYDRELRGWSRVERSAWADGARPRVEVLWLNPSCARRLGRPAARAAA